MGMGDFDVAKEVLKSKFIIGSCDSSAETLRRLIKMFGYASSSNTLFGDQCIEERQSWNEACRNMEEIGQKTKRSWYNLQILRNIESKHHYDMMLYAESKKMFIEQNILFE